MVHTRSTSRVVALGAVTFSVAILAAACGGSASPSTSASQAASVAPSVEAPASPSPSPSPSPRPSPSPSPSPSASAPAVAEDPAKGLKIAAPYTLVELDPALTQYFRNTMTKSMGGLGNLFSIGLRQVAGGKAQQNILIVMGFPTGMLDDVYYKAAVGGMTAAMDATDVKKTSVSGVEVSSAKIATGTLATFHIGDHLVMIISVGTEAFPVAKAVVAANK